MQAPFTMADFRTRMKWCGASFSSAEGELKVMDTADRAFEAFCLQYSSELNFGLMDQAVAKWLIDEYGLETATQRTSQ
jgi:hypothetical protein